MTTQHTNRLAKEKSPYLLQHQHNPVDWYPWGAEAFEIAKKQDKPIFLSVGYSTCHWCHVMERESFENPQIAKMMNDYFVNIKVDREERPDVDRVYMSFVQATTGGGGWPMSVFLTPDLEPFFGGTYFPPHDDMFARRPSFPTLMQRIHSLWTQDKQKLIQQGKHVMEALQQHEEQDSELGKVQELISHGQTLLQKTQQKFIKMFDNKYGGFGGAPKFPRPVIFNILFRLYAQNKDSNVLHACTYTLEKMAQGGMYDHLGGGFHRYSVDALWHVPHFEKMLYDQAQLVQSYLDAYQITHNEYFATVAQQVIDYVLRDMTDNQHGGGFFSAEDADSLPNHKEKEKKEGAFYVWTRDEIEMLLGKHAHWVQWFCDTYHVQEDGNVSPGSDPHGELTSQNVLIRNGFLGKSSKQPPSITKEEEDKIYSILLKYRNERPRPHLDDKVLTSWNGIMIGAMARASIVLKKPHYLQAAIKATYYLLQHHYNKQQGILYRTSRLGQTNTYIHGFLQDYAFLISGLLDLYEASGKTSYLDWAYQLQLKQNDLFMDKKLGGSYYDTDGLDKNIKLRQKESYDGAEPSGNSVSVQNLLRLAEMLDMQEFKELASKTLLVFQDMLEQLPQGCPQLMCGLDMLLHEPKKVLIVCKNDTISQALEPVVNSYEPNKVLVLLNDESREYLTNKMPYLKEAKMIDDKATYQICQNMTCQKPSTTYESKK